MNKITNYWTIILALVIVAGLGAYAYKNPPQLSGNFSDDVSTWEEYRNDNQGFSFKYPSDLKIIDDTPNTQTMLYLLFTRSFRGGEAPIFGAAILAGGLDENREKFENDLNAIDNVSYAGREGFRVRYGDAGCTGESVVLPLKENTLIVSSGYCEGDLSDPEENKKIYGKVLDSLKIE